MNSADKCTPIGLLATTPNVACSVRSHYNPLPNLAKRLLQTGLSQLEPVLVMSRLISSARLKLARFGWLSHFKPSCGNTTLGMVLLVATDKRVRLWCPGRFDSHSLSFLTDICQSSSILLILRLGPRVWTFILHTH